MRLQKIILCAAIALTAFGASLGLLEIGAYIRAALQPVKVEFKPIETVQSPVFSPPSVQNLPIPDFPPAAFTPTAENEPVEEAEPEDWGNTGDYFVIDEKPEGFEDFLGLSITDREWNDKTLKVVPVKPEGAINIYLEKQDDVKEFKFSSIKINGKRLSLATEAKRGISYRLEGRFVSYDVEVENEDGDKYTETVYLKGRLSKWRDGKKIAEASVRFGISHGC